MTYIGLETSQYERTAPTGGNPLPAGLYTGVVTRTQLKDTKNRDGNYLEVEFDITSPPEYNNRKFWDRFNILNNSPEASRIGKEHLSDLAKACGLELLSEDTDLHGREVTLILRVRPASGNFAASNECVKYWPIGITMDEHNEWMKSGKKNTSAVSVSKSPAQKQSWGAKPSTDAPAAQEAAKATTPAKPWQQRK